MIFYVTQYHSFYDLVLCIMIGGVSERDIEPQLQVYVTTPNMPSGKLILQLSKFTIDLFAQNIYASLFEIAGY